MYAAIVDDEPSVARALSRLLHAYGIDSRTYASAREFLASLDGEQPACLIVDALMPDMTGLELQAELSRIGADIPTIVLTADINEAARQDSLRAGAITYVHKPVDAHTLIEAVERAIRRE